MGYEFLDKSASYYLDPDTAMWFNDFIRWKDKYVPRNEFGVPKRSALTHRRFGPQPVARIWRPFYSPDCRRFASGLWLIDLFSIDQMDRWQESAFTPDEWQRVLAYRAQEVKLRRGKVHQAPTLPVEGREGEALAAMERAGKFLRGCEQGSR